VKVAMQLAPKRNKVLIKAEEVPDLAKDHRLCNMCSQVCPNLLPVGDSIEAAKNGNLQPLMDVFKKCIGCGKCDQECPRHVPIIKMMQAAASWESWKMRVGRGPIMDVEIRKVGAPIVLGTIPGIIAMAMTKGGGAFQLPIKPDGRLDFDMALPSMLAHLYPSGMLGVGLTALMASFMSGMAGNVTAFNSVWTYDLYQAHIRRDATDSQLLWVGRTTTVVAILLSVATAYLARTFNNIMDLLQLVFGFVNAPLFATFLLGMFWKRTTGHGAFTGLLSGTLGAAITHGITLAEGKGGWLLGGAAPVHVFRSAMGQAFSIAIVAWTTCFVMTILVSLLTRPRPDDAMRGLVYSLTERLRGTGLKWYARPAVLAAIVLAATIFLNAVFW
jgi:SSS family solute:Na+ symporter